MVKGISLAAILVLVAALPASAGELYELAEGIGKMLLNKFEPEAISVSMSSGGSFAWAEAHGARIEEVRVDSLKMRALLKAVPKDFDFSDVDSLAKLILSSQGEAVLLEKDINDYFATGVDTRGFSDLTFDFFPEGYVATGIFSGKFIIPIRIRLKAKGTLALRNDGIYLDKTSIYVEEIKQPKNLTNMIVGRVNPLLPFSKIPFPVDFKEVVITDDRLVATSGPEPFEGDVTWSWSAEKGAGKE